MAVESLIRQLLEAGVHFGHQTKRWNPKMKQFIYGERSGIYIIDLQQTAQRLKAACDFLKDLAAKNRSILFVGTKKQAKDIVASQAASCGMFFVTERWLGGTLTNFKTVRKSVERLKGLQEMKADHEAKGLTKKEIAALDKEITRLDKKLSGIVGMKKLPAALVIIDPKKEHTAIAEARRLEIPVIALLDTNCDPDGIDFPVPGNDDAIRSISLIASMFAESVSAGKKQLADAQAKEAEEEKEELAEGEASSEKEELLAEEIEKKVKEPEEPVIRKKEKPEGKKR